MNGYNKNAALRADCYPIIVPTFVLGKLVHNTLKIYTRKDIRNYVQKNQ